MLKKYFKGTVEGGVSSKKGGSSSGAGAGVVPAASTADHGGSPLSYAIPVLILLGALWYQFIYKHTS